MDDLIKELRAAASRGLAFAPQYIKNHLCWIAADRIADLERQIAELRQPTAQQGSLTSVEDAERLVWAMSNMSCTVDHRHFAAHVIKRGGTGDLSDCRTFVDAALQAGKEKER